MLVALLLLWAPHGVACTGLVDDLDYRQLYRETYEKYRHTPLLQTTLDNKNEHFLAFKEHASAVFEHNDLPDKEWTAEINEFALETDSELQHHLGLNISEFIRGEAESGLQRSFRNRRSLPDDVDYTSKMTAVKSQGGCGSCWAFGAVASLEYQVNRNRKGAKKSLSEQQYTDCTYPRDGCRGGWPAACYAWSHTHGGHIASSASYPYTGRYGRCSYSKKKNALNGWTINPKAFYVEGDQELQAAVAEPSVGVVVVAIAVTGDFFSYSTGVYNSKNCGSNSKSINHAVNVVGYGIASDVPYWRVRNSWGQSWGDAGYINMKRGVEGKNVNMCQISDWAHYPVVSGSDAEEEEEEEESGTEDKNIYDEWCEVQDKELQGYATNERVAMAKLDEAKAACGAMAECNGLTTEGDVFTLRSGTDLVDRARSTSYLPGPCCSWKKRENRRLRGALTKLNRKLEKAKTECLDRDDCVGITCKSPKKCSLVSRTTGKKNRTFDSYVFSCRD